jgi:hypothetical protein
MAKQLNDTDYSWFNANEYELQHRLDFTDWALMLTVRVALKDEYRSQLASSSLEAQARKQFWDDYSKSVSISEYLTRKQKEKLPLPWRAPPLAEVTRDMLIPERRKWTITWMIAMSGCRVLLINPWTNYEDLKKRFDQWLRELGQEFGSPFKRRGRRGANIGVTKLHLRSWANHSILAVFDLDFHSEVFSKKPLSRSTLHQMINPKSRNAAEWAKRARRLVQQAVSGREFVIAKARSEAK